MNKKELEQFNKNFSFVMCQVWIGNRSIGKGCRKELKDFISQIKANQRKIIKQDLLKIANKGECEDLRREVEDYFKKL